MMTQITFKEALEILERDDGTRLYMSAEWFDNEYEVFPQGRNSLQKLIDLGLEDIEDLPYVITWHVKRYQG